MNIFQPRYIVLRGLVLIVLALLASGVSAQRGEFMSVDEFLAEAFAGGKPSMDTLWLAKSHKQVAESILQRDFTALRVRYWHRDGRSAWVLDEIGKDLPITIGVVVENAEIVAVRVLVFRESRGGEVRYPFFTEQFRGLSLDQASAAIAAANNPQRELAGEPELSASVDGITGATLSVRAMKKVATLALFFHYLSEAAPPNKG